VSGASGEFCKSSYKKVPVRDKKRADRMEILRQARRQFELKVTAGAQLGASRCFHFFWFN
jgi:hypothetical protein